MAGSTRRDPAEPDDVPVGDRKVTERRRSPRRSSQMVLRQIVDRLADGVVVVGADGRIRFANPAAESLFGRDAHELVGQEFGFPLVAHEDAEIEIVRRGSGIVVAELRVVDAVWDEEPATLVSLRDVTDRKRAEEHARQLERERAARAEAEAANQAKSEFLAVMSHELRTPLNAVLGYAELLDLGVTGTLSPAQRQQVNRILASGRHLLGLVNEILDFAKVEAGRLSVERAATSVAEVVDGAMVLAQPQAEARGLRLVVPRDVDRSLMFLGDRERVLQILANLLSNAVKFTQPGGEIRVSVSRETQPRSRHLHGDAWIVIDVADTGIGIAPDQQDAIFSPFVQAKGGHTRERDGTGLGLTISRRLARLMRGDVVVASEVGRGSTFSLVLPAIEAGGDVSTTVETRAHETAMLAVPRTRGLAAFGDALLHESEAILDAFVAQLRREELMPAAATLRWSQLADHAGALLASIAAALVVLDEMEGEPSSLVRDTADIQRFISDRHGVQRARLGWSEAALTRQYAVLREEVMRAMHRCFAESTHHRELAEAGEVIGRFLEQACETSRHALVRASHHSRERR